MSLPDAIDRLNITALENSKNKSKTDGLPNTNDILKSKFNVFFKRNLSTLKIAGTPLPYH